MTDQDQPNTTPDSSSPAGAQNTSNDEPRVPQARFNAIMAERNELKTRLDALETAEKQRKNAELTELERIKAEAEAAKQDAAQRAAELEAERQARLSDKRDNALAMSLAAAGAIDADETVTVLKAKNPEEVNALLSKSGAPDPDAIAALVTKAKTERAHHFRPGGPGSPSNRDGTVPTPQVTTAEQAMALLSASEQQMVSKMRIDPLKYVREKYGE